MKKLLILSMAVLVGGVAFQGCAFLDHPNTPMAGAITCEDETLCGGYENRAALLDVWLMTAGVSPSQDGSGENLEGGYYGVVQNMDLGFGCEIWGGGGYTRIDTLKNYADALWIGCPPGYDCYAGALLPLVGWASCEPDYMNMDGVTLCSSFNGPCAGPQIDPNYSIDPGPGAYPFETFVLCMDKTPGQPGEGWQNAKRFPPIDPCPGCGSTTAPVPDDCEGLGKVLVCHVPRGNPDNAHEICISPSALPAHLAHGDTEGSCGGGPGGPGLQLPEDRNFYTSSMIGYMLYADFSLATIGALPWTDDYNGGNTMSPFFGTGMAGARARILEMLNEYPVDERGFTQLSLRALSAYGRRTELSEPFDFGVRAEATEQGHRVMAMTNDQHLYPELLGFVMLNNNDGEALDLKPIDFELTDGTVVPGTLLQSAMAGEVMFNHSGIEEFVPNAVDNLRELEARTHRR